MNLPVSTRSSRMLRRCSLLSPYHHGLGAQLIKERIAHIGQRGFAVGAELGFHFRDEVTR